MTVGFGDRVKPVVHGSQRHLKFLAQNILALGPHRIIRPIFIVAPPRSGSSMLQEAFAQLGGLKAFVRQESDYIWNRVLPYSARSGANDSIQPCELLPWQRRQVRSLLYREAVAEPARYGFTTGVVGHRPIRYLDKTISNCFRLELIEEMFPDATFVYLLRDPRSNIASMIQGWPLDERFGKPELTQVIRRSPGAKISHWSYPAPPGWQSVVDREIPAICAWSWQQHVEAIIRHRSANPSHVVRYEDLVNHPVEVIERLADALEVPFGPESRTGMSSLPLSRTSVTPPSSDKWRAHRDAIERLLPLIADTVSEAGY